MSRDTASNVGVGCPFTATMRSPGRNPAAAAGVWASIAATWFVGLPVGASVELTAKKMTKATRMFISGPAAITATRFQVRALQYASALVPSSTSRSARRAERRAPVLIFALSTCCWSSGSAAWVPAKSPASNRRRTRWTDVVRLGSSRSAGAMYASRSRGDGRCIPGMRTSPPSGIAPMPYSMPLRLILAIAGGKPT